MSGYVDALEREAALARLPPATSVFFGGGTPSLLAAEQLARVLDAIPRSPGAEVTVECNPDTVRPGLLEGYAAAGVNRVSLGVQSMVASVLASLGRTHDVGSVEVAAAVVKTVGFDRFNLDLIYGAAGESGEDWRCTLERAMDLGPDHVSAYALTVEAGTPLADDPARHPDDDDQADKYVMTDEALTSAGLANYEISNWARPGHECRHNLLYWSQGDYRGLGCAAHSHRHGRRWWNVRTPERYLALMAQGRAVEAAGEMLDDSERVLEGLQLSLRTRRGVPAASLPDDDPALEGLVERLGDRKVLTRRGRLLANEVAHRLLPRGEGNLPPVNRRAQRGLVDRRG